MIGQCLSNKNESATVAKNQSFCQLNKAKICLLFQFFLSFLLSCRADCRRSCMETVGCLAQESCHFFFRSFIHLPRWPVAGSTCLCKCNAIRSSSSYMGASSSRDPSGTQKCSTIRNHASSCIELEC